HSRWSTSVRSTILSSLAGRSPRLQSAGSYERLICRRQTTSLQRRHFRGGSPKLRHPHRWSTSRHACCSLSMLLTTDVQYAHATWTFFGREPHGFAFANSG